ncbi:hypothetical protein OIU76_002152, partial [Salix suchowensis]
MANARFSCQVGSGDLTESEAVKRIDSVPLSQSPCTSRIAITLIRLSPTAQIKQQCRTRKYLTPNFFTLVVSMAICTNCRLCRPPPA